MAADDTAPPGTTPSEDPEREEDQWVMLIDPEWKPEHEQDQPPRTAIVGAWYIEPDGSARRFRTNHLYEPSGPDSPTDPTDASLRLVMRGELPVQELLTTLPDSMLIIGLDEQEVPIVTRAPDGYPSVLVVTALAHAERLTVPAWTQISAEALADALPEEGVDVLLNPGAPASTRIGAKEFREAVRGPAADERGPAADERPKTFAEPPDYAGASGTETARAAEPVADGTPVATAEDFGFSTPLPPPPSFPSSR